MRNGVPRIFFHNANRLHYDGVAIAFSFLEHLQAKLTTMKSRIEARFALVFLKIFSYHLNLKTAVNIFISVLLYIICYKYVCLFILPT